MSSTDYRVSTIVVLCKDCGNDVGLYPGRHKCPPRPAMPSMPSIPLQYQQPSSSSSSFAASSSRSANGSNGRMRPADLNPNSLHASGPGSYGTPSPSFSSPSSAYGSSRTPTSSSFQDRMGNGSRTPTASSFQDRMKERDREKQQREREEREAAARTIREDSRVDAAGSAASATTTTGGAGTTLWNRLKAAKEVINATITGEEKWPESDDSDYEGESHVTRVLREYADKKEDEEMAAKIAELDMMPTSGPGSKAAGAGSTSRNQYLRDAVRKEPATPSIISTSSNEQEDYYGKSLRARGESTGVKADPTERSWSPASASMSTNNSNNSYGSNNNNLTVSSATRNRYRTTSDASRDDALSRLEGKSEGDKLAAHVNNLGSTSPRARANSPNTGHRPQDAGSSSSSYKQQPSRNQYPQYSNQLSPSSAANPNSYSSSSSQRSVSPGANRRYDPPSPSGSGRYGGGQPQQPASPSYPSNNSGYRQQAPPSPSHGDVYGSRGRAGGDPSQGRGRPEYDRRPTYPPQTSGGGGYGQAPGGGNNLGAYGQRQQQHQQQQQPYQQYQQSYGASQGNYF